MRCSSIETANCRAVDFFERTAALCGHRIALALTHERRGEGSCHRARSGHAEGRHVAVKSVTVNVVSNGNGATMDVDQE